MSVEVVLDGDTIVVDSDAEEPATDYKKEELLRLRSGSLLSDYVSKWKKFLNILRLSITIMDISIQGIGSYLALLAKEANKVFDIVHGG